MALSAIGTFLKGMPNFSAFTTNYVLASLRQVSMLTTLAAELGHALVVNVLTKNYHGWEMPQAFVPLEVLPLLNVDPTSTVPDAVFIPYLGSLALHSAASTQPHTDSFSIHHFIEHPNNHHFQ